MDAFAAQARLSSLQILLWRAPCNSGTAPYSHANVLNLRVSGEGISVAGGISSLADEPRNEQARVGMLATIECSGHLPEPA